MTRPSRPAARILAGLRQALAHAKGTPAGAVAHQVPVGPGARPVSLGRASAEDPQASRLSKLEQELADSDAALGRATRELQTLRDQTFARDGWMRRAKLDAGYPLQVSFDHVWVEALSALRQVRAQANLARNSQDVPHLAERLAREFYQSRGYRLAVTNSDKVRAAITFALTYRQPPPQSQSEHAGTCPDHPDGC